MTTLYIDSKKVSALYIDGKKVQLGDQEPQYLTIEPLNSEQLRNDTYVVINHTGSSSLLGTFEAKLNDNDWTTISWEDVSHGIDYNLVKACDTSKEYLEEGDKLQLRNIDKWSSAWNDNVSLKITNKNSGAKVYGKMADSLTPEYAASTASYKLASFFKGSTGLKDASGLDLDSIVVAGQCYYNMFCDCTSLTQAPVLPATTLAIGCYGNMFVGCTSLTQAPALPATTLAGSCYGNMFYGCTSLTQAPVLPATTLAGECYSNMFRDCTSLTQAPALPATSLASSCYASMFSSCTSLTQAPALPATTLASRCYQNMFLNCTSLTQAPALPATALAGSCYVNMFYGCTSLTQAPALPATALASNCYNSMFNKCTKVTELHYPASVQNDSTFTGMSGSPWFGATNATVKYDL